MAQMIHLNFFPLNVFKRKRLKLGDKIKLWGGYSTTPEWLNGRNAYYGEVVKFITGPYKQEDVVIRLEDEISFPGIKGKILVLTLRYEGAIWGRSEIVHLHLFQNIPQGNVWCVNKEDWNNNHIESHASYKII